MKIKRERREGELNEIITLSLSFSPSAPQFTPYVRTLKGENRRCQGPPSATRLDCMHLHFASETFTFHSSLPQTHLLPKMNSLYDRPYHLPISKLS